jgi:CRP/FNR family transcriptional regulator, cyclic AMP receptor protein
MRSRYAGAELGAGRQPRETHRPRVKVASLLDLVPELAYGIDASSLAGARLRARVQVEAFRRGEWTPTLTMRSPHPLTGLLISDGLLVRETEIADRPFAELLGAGDLIYPWATQASAALPAGTWRALEDGHLAVVDERLISRLAPWPSIPLAMARVATQRGRFLAALAVTRRLRRLDDRLMLLFALLAERWGTVRPDGIVLRLPLSHELIARLAGTRRQAVTTSLGRLRAKGSVVPLADGALLIAGLTESPLLFSVDGHYAAS